MTEESGDANGNDKWKKKTDEELGKIIGQKLVELRGEIIKSKAEEKEDGQDD